MVFFVYPPNCEIPKFMAEPFYSVFFPQFPTLPFYSDRRVKL